MRERYAPHAKLFDQEELMEKKIAVIGTGPLAHYVLAGFCGLGIGKIFLFEDETDSKEGFLFFGNKPENNSEALEKIIGKINSDITLRRPVGELGSLELQPDLIIDATNNPESKAACLTYAVENEVPLISMSSSQFDSQIAVCNPKVKELEDQAEADVFLMEDYASLNQGGATSGVVAGISMEETRKILMPQPIDQHHIQLPICYNLLNTSRFEKNSDSKPPKEYKGKKNILMIGAGSIGTFTSLGLAQSEGEQSSLTVVDFDDIEATNPSRQILYAGRIGEKKVEVLKEKLSMINPDLEINIRYAKAGIEPTEEEKPRGVEYFGEEDLKQGEYHIIVGCLDNDETRKIINKWALKYEIPYIDGSSGFPQIEKNPRQYTSKSWVNIYIPGKTPCLECQKTNLSGDPGNGCEVHPDLIAPNMFAGSIEAAETPMVLSGFDNYKGFLAYLSFIRDRVDMADFINPPCSFDFHKGDKHD